MALEAVIGEDPPHVGMPGEHHAVKIVSLALIPIGIGKYFDDRRHGRRLVGLDFDSNARVMLGRQQMIDDVEPPLAAWPVDGSNVDKAPEQAAGVVAQKS